MYKYFEDPLKYANFIDRPCEKCGSDKNCLDTIYFDYSSDDIESVCMDCLDQGKALVKIPSYIYQRISDEVRRYLGSDSEEKIKEQINLIINELERTPPVQWIQNNDWQMCCGDAMKYLGEWTREDLDTMSESKDGKKYLDSILVKDGNVDVVEIWDDIGDYVAIFVFKCNHCNRLVATWQCF